MKGKSLFKKFGAMATAVAMVASVGVTAFAAETNAGVKVTSDGITVAETGTDTGIYKVTVPYAIDTGVTSTIGVTMLAYGAGGSNATMSDTTVYTDSMEIVGVDQNNAGSNATSFEFYVDTTENNTEETDENAIEVVKGEKIVVLLSCDGAAGANGYLVQIGKPDGTAAINGSASTTVSTDYPTSADDAIADVKAMLANDVVTLAGTNVTDVADINVEVVGTAYDPAKWQEQEVTYKVTVTSDEYEVNYGTAEYLTYTVTYEANTWTATGMTVTVPNIAKDTVTADLATAVKNAITSVTLTDDSEPANTAAVAVTADKLTIGNIDPTFDEDATDDITYTISEITLAAGQYERFEVAEGVVKATGVTVKVTAEDLRWTALTSAVAHKADETAVTTAEITLEEDVTTTTGAAVKAAALEEVHHILVSGTDKDGAAAEADWAVPTEWKVYASTDTEKATDLSAAEDLAAGSYVVEATVANEALAKDSTTVSITVTVKEAASDVDYGNVVLDYVTVRGETKPVFDAKDLAKVAELAKGGTPDDDQQILRANVNGDTVTVRGEVKPVLDATDLSLISQRAKDLISKFPVEE